MGLKLFDEKWLPKAFPKEGTDRVTSQMPKLLAKGRVLINAAYLMRQRINSGLQDWMDNYFFLGDNNLYSTDGRVKISLDSGLLLGLKPESSLIDGALTLPAGTYESSQGIELSNRDIKYATGKVSTAKRAKENKFWRILARHPDEVPKEYAQDANLLPAFVDETFRAYQERFAPNEKIGDLKLMAIYLDSVSNFEKMRAWRVWGLYSGSGADGGSNLDDVGGRLVGVAPEALNAGAYGASLRRRK